MKNIFKKVKAALAVGLIAALLSTSAYGTDFSSDSSDENSAYGSIEDWDVRGSVTPNAETGGLTYIPPLDVPVEASVQYENGLIVSPGYNPYDEGDDGISTQAIIGSDDRAKISDPANDERCRNTVFVKIHCPNGKTMRGTGFMIGPNAVATSGHLLCDYGYGENDDWAWADSVDVTPAYNTGTNPEPYGTVSADKYNFECGWGWAKNCDIKYDWGVIKLPRNFNKNPGYLGLCYNPNSWNETAVLLNGYPSRVRGVYTNDQYVSMGTISETTEHLCYSYDLDASGGNSGGPCYYYSGSTGYTAMGILQGGSADGVTPPYTTILKLDYTLYHKLVSYRT